MRLASGTRLGPYEILEPLGSGGMGEVYKARDVRLERIVAIKVISSRVAAEAPMRLRLLREARTASGLNHPHICTIYDVGQEGDSPFIAMEWLDGETLKDRLERGPLTWEAALAAAVQIAD